MEESLGLLPKGKGNRELREWLCVSPLRNEGCDLIFKMIDLNNYIYVNWERTN